MMRRAALIAAVAAAGLATAGGATVLAGGQPPRTLSLSFDEWTIGAGGPVAPGRVTLDERNAGAVEHDLVLVRTDRAADDLPAGLDGVAPELAGDIVVGEADSGHDHEADAHSDRHLRPGARRSRTVTLEPGRYVAYCPLPGHYEQGQRTVVTVG